MKKKFIGIGAVVLVLALILTLAPCCGKEKGEVKTFKIGVLAPLSGSFAQFGVTLEEGAKWAADKINDAGGIRVDGDTYMITIVTADTKATGSIAVDAATRLINVEGIHFVVGPLITTTLTACVPVFNQNRVFSGYTSTHPSSAALYPYCIQLYPVDHHLAYHRAFYGMLVKHYPEMKTIGVMCPGSVNESPMCVDSLEVAGDLGLTVVETAEYGYDTVDFYPQLTKLIAKNPDGIDIGGVGGSLGLISKQARELGYEGIVYAAQWTTPEKIEVAGEGAVGLQMNSLDWGGELVPDETRALYQEYEARATGVSFSNTIMTAYEAVMLFAMAIEEADSFDPDVVKAVLDDPDLRFDWFGFEDIKLGGIEYYGRPQVFPMPLGLSVVRSVNPVVVEYLDLVMVEAP